MKTRKYLKAIEIMSLYDKYNETFSYRLAAQSAGVVYTTALRLVQEIQKLLAGEVVKRKRGWDELYQAVRMIKNRQVELEASGITPAVETSRFSGGVEGSWEKADLLWEELKQTLAQLAVEMANERNQELVEAAKRSNLVGLIKQKWEAKT